VFAVTNDFNVCSEFSARARVEWRALDPVSDSEFARCSGSYKRQPMLQFVEVFEKRLELHRRFSGAASGGAASGSIRAGTTADAQDATGLDNVESEFFGAGEDLG
jgi:hypothetical protein